MGYGVWGMGYGVKWIFYANAFKLQLITCTKLINIRLGGNYTKERAASLKFTFLSIHTCLQQIPNQERTSTKEKRVGTKQETNTNKNQQETGSCRSCTL
eukprot:g13891.t1